MTGSIPPPLAVAQHLEDLLDADGLIAGSPANEPIPEGGEDDG